MTPPPLLSICIPSFNRAGRLMALVESLLAEPGRFEVRVHVDGSTDDSPARLEGLRDPRLQVSSGPNQGRAGALAMAVRAARGTFVMLFDDDDALSADGLRTVLADCARPLPEGCAGHIYHLADPSGHRVGSPFGRQRSNFLALRADHGVVGDKKEVVLAALLRQVMEPRRRPGMPAPRRVPTSLYWSRIALTHDVLCHETIVGTKTYLPGGMSHTIGQLKRGSAGPLLDLRLVQVAAFRQGRYRSRSFAVRALLGWARWAPAVLRDRAMQAG